MKRIVPKSNKAFSVQESLNAAVVHEYTIPDLIAEIEARDELLKALIDGEPRYSDSWDEYCCAYCYHADNHASDCPWKLAKEAME